jgi:hypothetical protein
VDAVAKARHDGTAHVLHISPSWTILAQPRRSIHPTLESSLAISSRGRDHWARRRLEQVAQIGDAEVALPFDYMDDDDVVDGEIVAEDIPAIAK